MGSYDSFEYKFICLARDISGEELALCDACSQAPTDREYQLAQAGGSIGAMQKALTHRLSPQPKPVEKKRHSFCAHGVDCAARRFRGCGRTKPHPARSKRCFSPRIARLRLLRIAKKRFDRARLIEEYRQNGKVVRAASTENG